MTLTVRLYPDGSFSAGVSFKRDSKKQAPEQPDPQARLFFHAYKEWGILKDLPSHPNAEEIAEEFFLPEPCLKLLPRTGAGGVTPVLDNGSKQSHSSEQRKKYIWADFSAAQRRKIRSMAVLMDQGRHSKTLSFVTLTLPGWAESLTNEEMIDGYRKASRTFLQWLRRRLKNANLPDFTLCIREPQKRGCKGPDPIGVPHSHILFCGKQKPRDHWILTPSELRESWARAVSGAFPGAPAMSVEHGGCRVESIKKSIGRYLSKYLSKKQIESGNGGTPVGAGTGTRIRRLSASTSLVKLLRRNIYTFCVKPALFGRLADGLRARSARFRYIEITGPMGPRIVGFAGILSGWADGVPSALTALCEVVVTSGYDGDNFHP